MILSAIRTRCKDRWRDPTNAILSDANWNSYINDAYHDVLGASPFWPWSRSSSSSITIASGVRSAALPADVVGVTAVYNITDDCAMQPVEGTDRVYRIWPDQNEVGVAGAYRVYGANLEVYPLPDKNVTLKIEFEAVPADLTVDSQSPPWPSQFHDMLVDGAMHRAYQDDGAVFRFGRMVADLAGGYQESFQAKLQALMVYVFSGTASRYPGVVDTFYDDH